MIKVKEYKHHPVADAFPMMDAKRFDEHLKDMFEHGQRVPIVLCDGMILDGRNRYRACQKLGMKPKTETFTGDPWNFAWSLNGARRDLAEMQRAAIKLKCDRGSDEWAGKNAEAQKAIDAEANRKRSEAAKAQPRTETGFAENEQVVVHNEPQPENRHKGRAARAKQASVSTATQARVEALANNRPDLLDMVASGKITGTEAMRQMKKDQVAEKIEDLPADKFTVIYADPPWAYNDKQGGSISESYGAAEKHYPSMTLSELKALDIKTLAAPDSVLFLWATCPLLEDALDLCAAWGFKYKAQFVWDKVKHNMGHYNSVRHELLLICTRGSCTPEKVKLFDSVQSIERKEHSRKPEEFRDIINTLYPSGKKIELFRRGDAPEGWSTWGNEAK